MKLNINDTFNLELPVDPISENYVRQVPNACFSSVHPTPCREPFLIHYSPEMLEEVGLKTTDPLTPQFLKTFAGNEIYPNTNPYAMCYGGHQFGSWAGQLGDGRAINLFEINNEGKQWALQLKGAGKTPYSRTADGLAVLRSSIREYLCSEAMYHLGVPTTRALSLVLSGNEVLRDMMYDGNGAYEKGAIVCRVAPSFIRFGNFQIFAARRDILNLKKLTDYTINHFYSHLGKPSSETYIKFIAEVAQRTMQMVLHWERVGFVHGVMNTDNMSILGLTIDYGPYGWLEDYDPSWTPNTTDKHNRRYRFGNQANIALWNVYQLANALVPLIDDIESLKVALEKVQADYIHQHNVMMLQKLGLDPSTQNADLLIEDLKTNLHQSEMDMTLFFRSLSSFDPDSSVQFIANLKKYSYAEDLPTEQKGFQPHIKSWTKWFERYSKEIGQQINPNRAAEMNTINPKYVLRNYMAQLAIDAADNEDYSLIEELFTMLKSPYDEQESMNKWFAKRPEWARNKVGCSQLSCSS